jgi:hypothetical protein
MSADPDRIVVFGGKATTLGEMMRATGWPAQRVLDAESVTKAMHGLTPEQINQAIDSVNAKRNDNE